MDTYLYTKPFYLQEYATTIKLFLNFFKKINEFNLKIIKDFNYNVKWIINIEIGYKSINNYFFGNKCFRYVVLLHFSY